MKSPQNQIRPVYSKQAPPTISCFRVCSGPSHTHPLAQVILSKSYKI